MTTMMMMLLMMMMTMWTYSDGTGSGSVNYHPMELIGKAELRRYKERAVVVELQVNLCTQ